MKSLSEGKIAQADIAHAVIPEFILIDLREFILN